MDDCRWLRWAHFQYAAIGSLLARPPKRGELQKELDKLAAKIYHHPIEKGEVVEVGRSTLERWYYAARDAADPIEALMRKIRSDAGSTKAMSAMLIKALGEQYQKNKNWSVQLHYDNLVALVEQKPDLGHQPSYATVRRRMRQNGWRKVRVAGKRDTEGFRVAQQRLEEYEVRSYESEYVNGLWHFDFHGARRRVADARGRLATPELFGCLDDCSRLCCHAQWFFDDENAEDLFHGLKQAFQRRGLPRSAIADRGSANRAGEIRAGMKRLGIDYGFTLSYSPYQNAKQEVFWGQIEGRLMPMLQNVEPLTLEFLNRATAAWVELDYNRSHHSELGCTPLERYLQGPDVSRPCVDGESLRYFFTVRQKRQQRQSDGTLSLKGVRFEVPNRFRHMQTLFVRFRSWDLSMAYLVDERTDVELARIYPLDKHRNASGERKTLDPVANAPAPDVLRQRPRESTEQLPPLMRKILEEYAATGMPPAYMPKDE